MRRRGSCCAHASGIGFHGRRGCAAGGADCLAGIKGRTRRRTRTEGVHFRWRRRGRHLCNSDRQMAGRACDDMIDYTAQDISKAGGKFDAGFDLVGGNTLERMFGIMRPGARIVSVAAIPEPQTAIKDLGGRRALSAAFWIISYGIRSRARRAGIGYRYLFMHPNGRDLAQLSELIEQEKLKIIVDKTYPFARISEALAYVESGHAKGKVVVRMG